ncbi:MAG: glycine--tRNA ligase subunit beta, partial [Acidobacteria bacterium]|nr:glycine--tRNA ligase subunit beta [Acidobacteriota bacterium]
MPDLLIEIGCEEIPARMIDAAREELARRISDLLQRERLSAVSQNGTSSFSTPRRLAVLVQDIQSQQPDIQEQLVGPATKIAYKEGKPTAAAEAFARKAGIEVSRLEKVTNPKGEYIAATVTRKGRSASEIISESLPKELNALYWAKNMYWRAGKPERFVRPVRWIVGLLDGQVLPLEYAGVKAGSQSRGHRILSAGEIRISKAADYDRDLRSKSVVANPSERLERIRKALDATARTVPGTRWREDGELLNTVVNLTEFPGVVLGTFDRTFLSLPEEVLVTVMRD